MDDYFSYGGLFALMGGMLIFFIILAIVLYVVVCIPLMKLFDRAYVEKWKAWVPIVNTWTMLQLGGLPGWLSLLVFIPIVGTFAGYVVTALANFKFSKAYGKDTTFCVLSIFFGLITNWIMALDANCEYEGPQ